MNKNLIKTVTAGVVGIAIIAGTAGTFATWQREAIQSVGSIQTGDIRVNLNLSDWTASNSAKPVRFLDDITFVPGTTATATLSGHVALEGLTLNDVQVDFDIFAGPEINVAKDGFITYRGEPTQLRVRYDNPVLAPNGAGIHPFTATISVEFVERAGTENSSGSDNLNNMYDNKLDIELHDFRVVATMSPNIPVANRI